MHLHGQSEHTVNGAYYPLEAHMVHIPDGEPLNPATISQALVVGVFLSPGAKTSNRILNILTYYLGASYVVGASGPTGRTMGPSESICRPLNRLTPIPSQTNPSSSLQIAALDDTEELTWKPINIYEFLPKSKAYWCV